MPLTGLTQLPHTNRPSQPPQPAHRPSQPTAPTTNRPPRPAGTNNARLAGMLRGLASYFHKEPTALFLVRLAQGMVHMGKGLMTANPYHTDRQLLSGESSCGQAGRGIPRRSDPRCPCAAPVRCCRVS